MWPSGIVTQRENQIWKNVFVKYLQTGWNIILLYCLNEKFKNNWTKSLKKEFVISLIIRTYLRLYVGTHIKQKNKLFRQLKKVKKTIRSKA